MTKEELVELNKSIMELSSRLQILVASIEALSDRVDDVAENTSKIKEAVYNPDQGLYARLREIEQWKKATHKLQWLMVSAVVGLIITRLWSVV